MGTVGEPCQRTSLNYREGICTLRHIATISLEAKSLPAVKIYDGGRKNIITPGVHLGTTAEYREFTSPARTGGGCGATGSRVFRLIYFARIHLVHQELAPNPREHFERGT
eukprot:2097981-Pyramimonas_sp.AAC.1